MTLECIWRLGFGGNPPRTKIGRLEKLRNIYIGSLRYEIVYLLNSTRSPSIYKLVNQRNKNQLVQKIDLVY